MPHEIHGVAAFEKVAPYTLRVEFADETSQVIDFRPVLKGGIYGPLRDEIVFDQVSLDAEARTLVWPTGADFDPAILHDWPARKDDLAKLAEKWNQNAA